MIIIVDATTFAVIQILRAMWYMSLLLLAGLAFLVWAIYAGGAKLVTSTNPNLPEGSMKPALGGIGAVLVVILIPMVVYVVIVVIGSVA